MARIVLKWRPRTRICLPGMCVLNGSIERSYLALFGGHWRAPVLHGNLGRAVASGTRLWTRYLAEFWGRHIDRSQTWGLNSWGACQVRVVRYDFEMIAARELETRQPAKKARRESLAAAVEVQDPGNEQLSCNPSGPARRGGELRRRASRGVWARVYGWLARWKSSGAASDRKRGLLRRRWWWSGCAPGQSGMQAAAHN